MDYAIPVKPAVAVGCFICETPLPKRILAVPQNPSGLVEPLVCKAFECQQLMALRLKLPPSLFNAPVRFHQNNLRQQKEKEQQQQQWVVDLNEREARENADLLAAIVSHPKTYGINPPQVQPFTKTVAIPSSGDAVTALLPSRIEQYRQHLEAMIEEALSYMANDEQGAPALDANNAASHLTFTASQNHPSYPLQMQVAEQDKLLAATPALKRISDKLCTLCQGGCCPAGQDHAFVTALTIYRVLKADASLTPEAVLALYLGKLEPRVVAQGCVNQTPAGCVLPRHLRADVCNLYYCDNLRAYQKSVLETPEANNGDPIVAVQRAHNAWNRLHPSASHEVISVAVIDEKTTQLLPVLELAPPLKKNIS